MPATQHRRRRSAAARTRARSGAGTPCRPRRSSAGSRSCRARRTPGSTNRKIISAAWFEIEDVERLRVEVLVARLRELGAEEHREEAADAEEDDRRDEVLDADHLVVGVDAEVVAPRARAVAGVVLGARRPAATRSAPSSRSRRSRRGSRAASVTSSTVTSDGALPDRVPVREPSGSGTAGRARSRSRAASPRGRAASRARSGGGARSARGGGAWWSCACVRDRARSSVFASSSRPDTARAASSCVGRDRLAEDRAASRPAGSRAAM